MALTPYPSLNTIGGTLAARKIDAFAARTVYASTIPGVTIGCDLATGLGPGGATISRTVGLANAAAINAVLATATAAQPIHLFVDSGIAIGKALLIPATGYVTITGHGWKTGFYVQAGSNSNAIQNFAGTDFANYQAWNPSGSQGGVGSFITLAEFHVNCNRGTYPNGNSNGTRDGTITSGNAPTAFASSPDARGPYTSGYWLSGIILVGIDNLRIDHVSVYDAPAYHVNLYHCADSWIDGCKIVAGDNTVQNNTDGFHLNGGTARFAITDCDVRVGDDPFAINIAEGDGQPGGDIMVSGCRVDSLTIGRIYGKGTSILGRVTFSNITGNVSWYGFVMGESSSADTGADSCQWTTLQNINVNNLGRSGRSDYALVLVSGNCGVLELINCKTNAATVAHPMVRMDANSPVISSLRLSGCGIYRTGNTAPYAVEASHAGAIIKSLVIDNFYVNEQAPNSYTDIPALVNCDGATVLDIRIAGQFVGVAKAVNVTANSTVSAISLDNFSHKSNQGSGVSVVTATTGHSAKIPVSVGHYKQANVARLASGDVTLTGSGLVSSGFALTDAIVADNSTYHSSDQSVICWKSAGVAIPLGTVPAATAYTLSGPGSGTTGSASTNFTIQPNGTYTGTITVTPSGGGLSTPIVKTFSSSSAPQTFTITPASNGTVTLTGTNSASLTNPSPLSYVASSGSGTLLDDTFTGTTGATLTGATPAPTANGSDVYVADGAGPGWAYAAGGGVTSGSGSGGSAYNSYPLTGASANQTITCKFKSSTTDPAIAVQFHRQPSEVSLIQVDYAFGASGGSSTTKKWVAGSASIVGSPVTGIGLALNTVHTMIISVASSGGTTTVSATINGTSVLSSTPFTDANYQPAGYVEFLTQSGSAGDLVVTEFKVTTP